jgi:hypothetical protein
MVPLETRKRIYPNPNNHEKPFHGSEIVREAPKCPGCLGQRTLEQATEAIKRNAPAEFALAQ